MKTISFKISILMLVIFQVEAVSAQEKKPEKIEQKVNEYMQLAESALAENNFPMAEANYRKAISLDTSNAKPLYNMGTLYYTKDKPLEASGRLWNAGNNSENKTIKHSSFHNQGNALMKQKNYRAAVEAYKNALRSDPTDDETRYNYALAKKMLEKEEEKQKDGPKDDKKKEEEKKGEEEQKEEQKGGGEQNEKENKGDEQKNKQGDPKEKGEQKDKSDQQQENKPPNSKQPQQPKPASGQLSKQQVKNLLEAMQNQEREIQDKVNTRKAKGSKTNSEKDW